LQQFPGQLWAGINFGRTRSLLNPKSINPIPAPINIITGVSAQLTVTEDFTGFQIEQGKEEAK